MNLVQVIFNYRKNVMILGRDKADKWLADEARITGDIAKEVKKCVTDNGYLVNGKKRVMDLDYV